MHKQTQNKRAQFGARFNNTNTHNMPFFITECANESAAIKLYKCSTLKQCLKKFYEICSANGYDVIETDTLPRTVSMREYSVEIYFHHKTK